MDIRFIDLKTQYANLKPQIDAGIQAVLDHGQYILGPEVKEAESKLAEFVGCKHALTCGNGTDALMLALMAIDTKAGDEVIVPGFSFFATAEVVSFFGATPVFVDVEEDSALIDVSKIEAAITDKTKAIIPVGLYGQLADMPAIMEIANKHKLTVIEDAAQSFGATIGDTKSCNFSHIACTSFFPAKPLGVYGDGGACFTNDADLFEKMRRLRMHGEASRYNHEHIGMNARFDTIQAAVLLPKLAVYPEEIVKRGEAAARYDKMFSELSEFVTPTKILENRKSVYAQYTIKVQNRAELQAFLQEKKIPTAVHYPKPMYKQPVYEAEFGNLSLEVSEKLASCVMSLPMHPYLEEDVQKHVFEAIKEFYTK